MNSHLLLAPRGCLLWAEHTQQQFSHPGRDQDVPRRSPHDAGGAVESGQNGALLLAFSAAARRPFFLCGALGVRRSSRAWVQSRGLGLPEIVLIFFFFEVFARGYIY